MSYGMNHEEFEAATGLKNGSAVEVEYPDGTKRKGKIGYYWGRSRLRLRRGSVHRTRVDSGISGRKPIEEETATIAKA